jgi:hypothetical protein
VRDRPLRSTPTLGRYSRLAALPRRTAGGSARGRKTSPAAEFRAEECPRTGGASQGAERRTDCAAGVSRSRPSTEDPFVSSPILRIASREESVSGRDAPASRGPKRPNRCGLGHSASQTVTSNQPRPRERSFASTSTALSRLR